MTDEPLSTDELTELLAEVTNSTVEEIEAGAKELEIGPVKQREP